MFDRLTHKPRISHPLAGVALFEGCSIAELDSIVSITTLIDVAAGRTLCHEAEGGDECFVIMDGEVEVSVAGGFVTSLGDGDVFGELALLDRGPRTATVTTTRPTRVLVLTRPEFVSLLERVPTVCQKILAGVAHRRRQPLTRSVPVAA